ITNLDEVAPSFDSLTTAAVNENIGAGQVVYTAAATDPTLDTGPSNPVTYSFGGGADDGDFTIDGVTGAVTLTADPDAETKSSYSFAVTATDAAGNATTQTVTLAINDLDEVAPSFDSLTTAAVNENIGAGQVVYTAAATDPTLDTGPSNPVTYSFGGGADDGDFTIDGVTGAVTLTADPDAETKSSYSFAVTATDAAGNATTQTVTLAINDLDEVAPSFDSLTTAAVNENIGAGQVVYTAAATDPMLDTGPSNPVTYSFGGGADDGDFTIDGVTGAVTLTADPDAETKSSYSFAVTATDAAGNATTQTVTLAINDVDEFNPAFTASDY